MLSKKALKSTLFVSLLTIAGMAISFQANAACEFISTKDGSPLVIEASDTDSAEAKAFLETCKNPYNKIFVADEKAAKKQGRRVYTYNGCSGCHGGKLEGIMAPSLRKDGGQGAFDSKWAYGKNATDKGMFETIAGGSAGQAGGVMAAWHVSVPDHISDGLSTDDILKAMAYIRTQYHGDGEKKWLN
jgi:cytochrome c-L